MVQRMSACALAAYQYGGLFGSIPARRTHLSLAKETVLGFGVERRNLRHHFGLILPYIGWSQGCRNLQINAGWPFQRNNPGLDPSSEHSESANEDILMFFFQLDLGTRVQFALNLEQYDIAKQLRNTLAEVEEEINRQQEKRRGSSSKSEVQNMAISILRMRAEQQTATENENYSLAAELRDEISKREAESLAASVKAQAYESAEYKFRLGQQVRHKIFVAQGNLLAPEKPDMAAAGKVQQNDSDDEQNGAQNF